ncbi:MAG: hypothetical protein EHM49_03545 [Deltaproteobacteria bacterium]|nr:MAG: hypothetical protein EHM49_03545 [Deltaproteobacteria bacterium]
MLEDIRDNYRGKFGVNPGLEAKTLFEDLQRSCLGRFSYGSYGPCSAESRYDAAVEEYPCSIAAKRKRPMA